MWRSPNENCRRVTLSLARRRSLDLWDESREPLKIHFQFVKVFKIQKYFQNIYLAGRGKPPSLSSLGAVCRGVSIAKTNGLPDYRALKREAVAALGGSYGPLRWLRKSLAVSYGSLQRMANV